MWEAEARSRVVRDVSESSLCPVLHEGTLSILPVRLPVEVQSGLHRIDTVWTVVVELQAEGESGLGYAFAFEELEAQAIAAEVQSLFPYALQPRLGVRDTWRRMWRHINHVGQAGPPLMALSMIDGALWDIAARSLRLPLYQLLGGATTRFVLYGSGGWLTYSIDELLNEVGTFEAAGYRAYKMKVGHADWSWDRERVQRVLEAVGGRLEIMVDANQSWAASEATMRIRELADLGVAWVEEPVDASDLRGLLAIKAGGIARLAAGETLTLTGCIGGLIRERAVDIVMPDLMRCGGPSGMSEVMTAARQDHVGLSPHMFPELSAHVASAFYGPVLLEDIVGGWADSCFESSSIFDDGQLDISDCVGNGLRLREDVEAARRLRLSTSLP